MSMMHPGGHPTAVHPASSMPSIVIIFISIICRHILWGKIDVVVSARFHISLFSL